jgi:hypothetical protein
VKALQVEARRAGLAITFERKFAETEAGFAPLVAAAAARHPDVYYIEALNPALDRLARRFFEAGIRNLSSVVAPSLSQEPELFEGPGTPTAISSIRVSGRASSASTRARSSPPT